MERFNLRGSVSYKCWCMLDALAALAKNVSGMTNDQQDGESKVQLYNDVVFLIDSGW